MDPNANLKEQRQLVKELNEAIDNGDEIQSYKTMRLVELVETLDAWLTASGALPKAWANRP